jgi:signal transduction histidine kinase
VGDETTLIGTDRRARLVGIGLINGMQFLVLLGLYFGIAQNLLPAAGVRDPVAAHGVALVCVVVLAYPLRRRLGKLVSRLLRRDWQETQDLLRDVGAELGRTIEPVGLQALLVETLPRRLRLQSATLWMLEPPDDRAFIAIGQDAGQPGATLLANGASATQVRYAPFLLHVPERHDLEWAPLLLAQGVRVALPLRVGDRLVGIYGIGEPIGQREYPPHVIDVLLMLAPAIASAVQNARAYTEIAHLNAHLRALDQLKDEFIESVGHELRTPLTSLTLALQLMAQNPEMARDMARVLRGSVDRLQMVVDRVLRLDRYRHEVPSHQRPVMEPIELQPLLDDIVAEYRPSAQAKGLQLRVVASAGLAAWGDSAYLRRALHEVLDNAVRYSEGGAVSLSADLRDGLVVISIADEGPGIPADERTHLFDAFYRGRTARALAERPGVGVGLSLARRDLEALGGQIWLQETGAVGSVMCLSLPGVTLAQKERGLVPASHDGGKPIEQAVFSRSEEWR